MATLKDVAAQAGVSVTTASLILNGKAKEKHISDKTIQLVLEAAEQLQYRPNHSARQLRVKTFSRPRVCFYWPLDVRSNLLGYRLAGLQNALVEQNLDYELVVQNYYNNHIEDFIAPLTKGYYDAAIIGGASPHDVEMLETMDFSVPIVLLNRESRKFASVGVNNSHVGLQAAVLMQKRGIPGVRSSKRPPITPAAPPEPNRFYLPVSSLALRSGGNGYSAVPQPLLAVPRLRRNSAHCRTGHL